MHSDTFMNQQQQQKSFIPAAGGGGGRRKRSLSLSSSSSLREECARRNREHAHWFRHTYCLPSADCMAMTTTAAHQPATASAEVASPVKVVHNSTANAGEEAEEGASSSCLHPSPLPLPFLLQKDLALNISLQHSKAHDHTLHMRTKGWALFRMQN